MRSAVQYQSGAITVSSGLMFWAMQSTFRAVTPGSRCLGQIQDVNVPKAIMAMAPKTNILPARQIIEELQTSAATPHKNTFGTRNHFPSGLHQVMKGTMARYPAVNHVNSPCRQFARFNA